MLEVSGYCVVTTGEEGGEFLSLKEDTNTPVRSASEVIAHAMQCPPITEDLLAGAIKK
jgi:hypothetical protein